MNAGKGKGEEFDRPARGRGHADDPHRRASELARARDRYNGVADDSRRGKGHAGFEREVGGRAHAFSRAEVEGLIGRGWRAEPRPDRFRNHGERVSTMVELAKRLGYGARVGAMQANFGTPQENDIAGLQEALAAAEGFEAAARNQYRATTRSAR